ncbi:hypothetical protein ACH5RR_017710 [Cinchona calisaya]|uniref:Uncharacterized protein n=1 Tax=Cinchona calisaya TaxID=153742 RepID=A0ABD2ZJB9_9GENT
MSGFFRWNDKFSLARVEEEKLNFWVLENYKKQKWGERKHVISLQILKKHPNSGEFMSKYLTFRKLWYVELKRNRLWICVDDDNSIAYNVGCGWIDIISPPRGKKIYGYYTPSLVHIQGMRSQRKCIKRTVNVP